MNNTKSVSVTESLLLWNYPNDLLTRSQYLLAVYILNYIIKPVILAVGLPTNVINCVVFWRQGLGDRMNVCLFALSVVDLCMISLSTLFSITYYMEQSDLARYDGIYSYCQIYLSGVGHGFRTASGFITIVIAVERCLCVTFPLKAASLISTRTMRVTMAVIGGVSQMAFVTVPLRLNVVRVTNSTTTVGIISSDMFLKNQVFFTIFENMIMMNVVPLATFIIICVCTALTVVKLRAAFTWRKTTSCSSEGGQGQHTALTKMLVLVCCVYILTTIPWVIFYLATLTWPEFFFASKFYYLYMTSIVTVFYFPYINSSVGFFVYFSRSTRFRQDVNTCGRWCKAQVGGGQEADTVCKTLTDL
ncbi:somatostatin receptor type 3-like [Pomacea canaliculata]|uniref:somatostatin receptor type 3-like n=1 Tax=Pomacea canaliculata TaxID=400727 RepID=UPI000D72DFB5|nr:somatostatin receptor type 3-like [Pomacea canaliculata]